MSGILILKYFKMLPCEICQTPFICPCNKKKDPQVDTLGISGNSIWKGPCECHMGCWWIFFVVTCICSDFGYSLSCALKIYLFFFWCILRTSQKKSYDYCDWNWYRNGRLHRRFGFHSFYSINCDFQQLTSLAKIFLISERF